MPSTVAIVGYIITLYLFSLVLKQLPVGTRYAVWSGLGIALMAIAGAVQLKQTPDAPALIGTALIIAGVLCITLLSNHMQA